MLSKIANLDVMEKYRANFENYTSSELKDQIGRDLKAIANSYNEADFTLHPITRTHNQGSVCMAQNMLIIRQNELLVRQNEALARQNQEIIDLLKGISTN